MPVAPRDPAAETQIRTAREMPSSADDDADRARPDSQQCKDAERPTESHPGAPNKLPGYGK
jgi:hypothetical protein